MWCCAFGITNDLAVSLIERKQSKMYPQLLTSGGSKGGREGRAPPPGSNSFNFMQFLRKFGIIVCWRPPEKFAPLLGEILDPPLLAFELSVFFSRSRSLL